MKPEQKVKTKLRNGIKALAQKYRQDIIFYNVQQGTFSVAGVADYHLVLAPFGVALAIEVKAEHGKLTSPQARFLKRMFDAGGLAVCIYPNDVTPFLQVLENYYALTVHGVQPNGFDSFNELRAFAGRNLRGYAIPILEASRVGSETGTAEGSL